MKLPAPTPGLAVTLSASFLGFYSHAGFLMGLAEAGLWPVTLAGCSSGALVAGLAAAGLHPQEILDFLLGKEFRWGFFEPKVLLVLGWKRLCGRGSTGILSGRKAVDILRRRLGDRQIEDFTHPSLAVAVTNLTRMRAEVRTHGPLAETIIASCAFPTIFQVQHLDGGVFWDGGIANCSPVDHWRDDPQVQRVLVHSTRAPRMVAPPESGMLAACARGIEISSLEIFELRAERLRRTGREVELHVTEVDRPGMYITEKAALTCFEAGRRCGRAVVPPRLDAMPACS